MYVYRAAFVLFVCVHPHFDVYCTWTAFLSLPYAVGWMCPAIRDRGSLQWLPALLFRSNSPLFSLIRWQQQAAVVGEKRWVGGKCGQFLTAVCHRVSKQQQHICPCQQDLFTRPCPFPKGLSLSEPGSVSIHTMAKNRFACPCSTVPLKLPQFLMYLLERCTKHLPKCLYCVSQSCAGKTIYSLNHRLSKERRRQYRWSQHCSSETAALRLLMLWKLSAELAQCAGKTEQLGKV